MLSVYYEPSTVMDQHCEGWIKIQSVKNVCEGLLISDKSRGMGHIRYFSKLVKSTSFHLCLFVSLSKTKLK